MTSGRLHGKKLLFLISEDWYFWSHRKKLALACQQEGAEVAVGCRTSSHRELIENQGIRVHEISFDRSGVNPLRDAKTMFEIFRLLLRERPDILHCVAVKPVLYGSVAGYICRIPKVINTLAGLGFLYISKKPLVKALRKVFQETVVWLSNRRNFRLVVQNRDDDKFFAEAGLKSENLVTILGSGVDIEHYNVSPEPEGKPVAVCVSRLLVDKGIFELVEAARGLVDRNVGVTVRLVGGLDENPTSIKQSDIDEWVGQGIVEYAGHSTNVAAEYANAHIAVLPSYREGLPKSLLEAAACGRPMVASDVPGCREVCIDGTTGILVPPKDSKSLENALERLATDRKLRQTYGESARDLVENELSDAVICEEYISLYQN